MKNLCMVVALSALAAAAFAQAPADSQNRPLADAVKAAEDAKDVSAALVASQRLDAAALHDATWGANIRKLAQLTVKAGKLADTEALLKARVAGFATTDFADDSAKQSYRVYLVSACSDVAWAEPDAAKKVEIAALAVALNPASDTAVSTYAKALAVAGRVDDALKACDDGVAKGASAEKARMVRVSVCTTANRPDQAKAEAVEYLKIATDPAAAVKVLPVLLPANDASLCAGLTAQQVVDGYKIYLRKTDPRQNAAALTGLANQLTKGGDARPLVVTDEAKALAAKLAGAPLAAYIVPLLTGDYQAATKAAYGKITGAPDDVAYVQWVNATAAAVRCMDRCYNGRAVDFVKFINGTGQTNPIAGVVAP